MVKICDESIKKTFIHIEFTDDKSGMMNFGHVIKEIGHTT